MENEKKTFPISAVILLVFIHLCSLYKFGSGCLFCLIFFFLSHGSLARGWEDIAYIYTISVVRTRFFETGNQYSRVPILRHRVGFLLSSFPHFSHTPRTKFLLMVRTTRNKFPDTNKIQRGKLLLALIDSLGKPSRKFTWLST